MAQQKIFSSTGTRLFVFTGSKEHEWILKDKSGTPYFTGTAEELNKHINDMIENKTYVTGKKRRKRKKE